MRVHSRSPVEVQKPKPLLVDCCGPQAARRHADGHAVACRRQGPLTYCHALHGVLEFEGRIEYHGILLVDGAELGEVDETVIVAVASPTHTLRAVEQLLTVTV